MLYRYGLIGRRSGGVDLTREILSQFKPLLPYTHAVARRLRDLVHVATCIEERIGTIITPDRGFDEVTEVHRLDPVAAVR